LVVKLKRHYKELGLILEISHHSLYQDYFHPKNKNYLQSRYQREK